MKRESYDHGFPEADWEAAKAEARHVMVAAASQAGFVTYSDLVAQITALALAPRSTELAHMLGEISTAEHEAGRGMLTVVVVHKHGDQMPGPGFFRLARSLGYEAKDRNAFWLEELERVHRTWREAKRRGHAAGDARSQRRDHRGDVGDACRRTAAVRRCPVTAR